MGHAPSTRQVIASLKSGLRCARPPRISAGELLCRWEVGWVIGARGASGSYGSITKVLVIILPRRHCDRNPIYRLSWHNQDIGQIPAPAERMPRPPPT